MFRSVIKVSQCLLSKSSFQLAKSITNPSVMSTIRLNPNVIQKSFYGTKGESELANILRDEIKSEKDNIRISNVPKNFILKESKGSEIILQRKDDDGVLVEVKIDLAGSVGIDEGSEAQGNEEQHEMQSLPDFTVSLIKPSKRTITFNCSLNVEHQELEGDDITPTYSVESVEVDSVPGYYVLSEVMDMKVFENLTELLIERGLDLQFQQELQAFCTSEEHKLYCKLLEAMKQFCV